MNAIESRALEEYMAWLSQDGTGWLLQAEPDQMEQYQRQPSPDAIIGNGLKQRAVELKILNESAEQSDRAGKLNSLVSQLSEGVRGSYCLFPPLETAFPWDRETIGAVKDELRRVAPGLKIDEEGYLCFPRQSWLEKTCDRGSLVFDFQTYLQDVKHLEGLVPGTFFLHDGKLLAVPETEERRQVFFGRILSAAQGGLSVGEMVALEAVEEWKILKTSRKGHTVELMIILPGDPDIGANLRSELTRLVRKANAKFWKKWADRHDFLMVSNYVLARKDNLRLALRTITHDCYENLDRICLLTGQTVDVVWDRGD